MRFPTIHLNGTSADEILKQLRAAQRALQAAVDALCQAAPNGRDYYPQGDGAHRLAEQEHGARVVKLREVLHELGVIHEAVYDQKKARDR